jgi:periplasmic divalent cation tolerance protein
METMSVIYSTFPNKEIANHVIRALIDQRLAACGNVWESSSMYMWQGDFLQEGEYCAFIKTLPAFKDRCITLINNMHPYDVPCILNWDAHGNKEYIAWLESTLSS